MKLSRIVIGVILTLLIATAGAAAEPTLLVLYKSSEGSTADQNLFAFHLHQYAESLGYQVRYHDIERGLPSDAMMADVYAIVTAYWGPILPNALEYIDWLAAQIRARKKLIVLNNFGAFSPDGETWYDGSVVNKVYHLIGLDFAGNWTNDPNLIRVEAQDPEIVGFETPLTPDRLTHYFTIRSAHPLNQVFLSLSRADRPNSASAVVVKTPYGGLAMENYVFAQIDGQTKKLLNLKRFLETCLAEPFPDELWAVTTPTPTPPPAPTGPPLLVLYKSSEGSTADQNLFAFHLHQYAESLGYQVRYHDIERGLPSDAMMADVYAIVTAYWGPILPNALEYIDWLAAQIRARKKLIVLNNFGAFSPDGETWYDGSVVNKVYHLIGLDFAGNWTNDPNLIRVEAQDPEIVGFETPLTPDRLTHYFTIRSAHPLNQVFLSLSRADRPNSASAVVVKTPYGGLAMENYVFAQIDGQTKKLLNLKRFLEVCLLGPFPEMFPTISAPPSPTPTPTPTAEFTPDTQAPIREPTPQPQAQAPPPTPTPTPIPEGPPILVLYKSSEGSTADQNIFAYHLAQFAASRGYTITYHDIDASLPSEAVMEDVHGIVTVYNGPIMANALEYIDWLSQQVLKRKKVLIIGSFGAFSPDGETWFDGSVVNPFYYLMGLEFAGNWTNDPNVIEIGVQDPDMVGYETGLTAEGLTHYLQIKSLRPDNTVFLSLKRSDLTDSESAVMVKTPVGGLVMENYVFAQADGGLKQLVNLQQFFDETLRGPMAADAAPDKKILALYKSLEDPTPGQSFISRFLTKDLILLGYWPEYYCVDDGAPLEKDMREYQAVITWFRTPFMAQAEEYANWLLTQIREDRKVIILGNYGAFGGFYQEDDTDVTWWVSRTELNHFLYHFGIEFLGKWIGDPETLVCEHKDSAMVEQEIALTPEDFRHYYHWDSVYPENEVYLQVGRRDLEDAASAFVARTPFGGFAFEGYLFKSDPETWELSFYLNRRQFLQACLEYETDRAIEPLPLTPHEEIFAELDAEHQTKEVPDKPPEIHTPAPNEVKRTILALYKRSEDADFSEGAINNFVEPVLNHLGFFLHYHAVEDGLPDDAAMQPYHGVLTWFTSAAIKQPEAYVAWLGRQVENGKKVVMLGDFGAWEDLETHIPYRRGYAVFEKLGAKVYQTEVGAGKQTLAYADRDLVDYERTLDLQETEPLARKIVSAHPDNHVVLRLNDSQLGTIEPIMITPTGAIALGDFLLYSDDPTEDVRPQIEAMLAGERDIYLPELVYLYYWRINPYRFFAKAFDLEAVPAPDVTTLNGYRIFYSHIDGDGFKGISRIDQSSLSSLWVMREIFQKYDLPITASVITREIEDEPSQFYNLPYRLARRIFAMEGIEPASHTYTHPFKWRKGDLIIDFRGEDYDIERVPIKYLYETEGSMRFIEANLLPPDKQTEVLLWSGDCHPNADPLRILYQYNRLNMNAGDPIFDDNRDSRTNLAPISNNFGGYRIIHTSGMNDYLYTTGWTRNFDGMKNLVSHFERTESPQRLSALNIYYHFYIGDRQLGLDGLREAYAYCYNRDIAPMFVSQYVDIARAFYQTRIFREPGGGWRITDNGKLRAVRFNNATRYPDLAVSQGVLGFGRVNADLYVYLDDSGSHTIRLTDAPPQEVYLAWGTHYVDQASASPQEISFRSYGYGRAEFVWANLRPAAKYAVTITPEHDGDPPVAQHLTSDAAGRLTIRHPFLRYDGAYTIRAALE